VGHTRPLAKRVKDETAARIFAVFAHQLVAQRRLIVAPHSHFAAKAARARSTNLRAYRTYTDASIRCSAAAAGRTIRVFPFFLPGLVQCAARTTRGGGLQYSEASRDPRGCKKVKKGDLVGERGEQTWPAAPRTRI
jgi:hypothetical protein